jgi:hypothetical protein
MGSASATEALAARAARKWWDDWQQIARQWSDRVMQLEGLEEPEVEAVEPTVRKAASAEGIQRPGRSRLHGLDHGPRPARVPAGPAKVASEIKP